MDFEITPSSLVDSVNYQDESVVSKTLIKKETGTVTLFAFDQDQALSEHTAPFDAMVYVFDGKAEVTISGKPSVVSPGEVIVMPANKPHSLNCSMAFKE